MKHRKILFLGVIILLVGFNFGSRSNVPESSASVCILKNITWMQANAKNGDQVKFKIDGQGCSLDRVTVRVMLYQPVLSDSEITKIELNFPRAGASDQDKILGDWQVTISSVAIFDSKIYLIANLDSAGTGTQLDSKGASIPFLTVTPPLNLRPSVTITNFDITPRKINANETTELTATFRAKVDTPSYFYANCSQVQAVMIDGSNREIYTQSPQPVSATNPDYKFDFRYRYDAKGDGVVNLKGKLKCLVFGTSSGTLPISSPVCIAIGSGVCGTGGGTGGGGTGGENQGFSFSIPNPLKGGADDLGGLVKVLAQWLFNISIPIAVAMIVYSGVLFLTAQGNPTTITKAKDVLKYAVIGLAIILIGSGFVTLIQSILELGSSNAPTQQQLPGPGSGPSGPGGTTVGAVGNKCSGDRDCLTGLKCQDSICKRATGNWAGEPCNAGRNCDVGLSCDKSGSAIQPIDGQTLGTCYNPGNVVGLPIGYVCTKDSECISGLKCNQICQRRNGNLNGEACLKTSSPSNCQSRACSTIGTAIEGTCVEYSGT